MQNSECIEIFENYLANEKKASANTLSSYLRDVRQLGEYLDIHHDTGITDATEEQLTEYIAWMKSNGKSVATVSRCIASIKCLYSYLRIKQLIDGNPASKLVPDKGEHKLPRSSAAGKWIFCLNSLSARMPKATVTRPCWNCCMQRASV